MKEIELTASLTFAQARRQSYKIFAGLSEKEQETQRKAIAYIESLGVNTGTDLSPLSLEPFMEDGKLITDKKAINKKFFTLKPHEDVPCPKFGITKKLCGELDKQLEKRSAILVKNLKRTLDTYTREATNYQKYADEAKADLERMGDGKFDLRSILEEVVADGFYFCPRQDPEEGFSLVTRPIVLSRWNEAQATRMVVPMGQYEVQVLLGGNGIYALVWPYDNNPVWSDYYHPHVDSGGQLCFGSAYEESQKLSQKYDFKGYLKLVRTVLQTYSYSGGPFAHLNDFRTALNEGTLSKRGWMPYDEEIQGKTRRPLRRRTGEPLRRPRPDTRVRRGRCRELLNEITKLNPFGLNGSEQIRYENMDYWECEAERRTLGQAEWRDYQNAEAYLLRSIQKYQVPTPPPPPPLGFSSATIPDGHYAITATTNVSVDDFWSSYRTEIGAMFEEPAPGDFEVSEDQALLNQVLNTLNTEGAANGQTQEETQPSVSVREGQDDRAEGGQRDDGSI